MTITRGAIYLMKKSYDEAVAHGTRAIELEPNAADATATLAMTLAWCSRHAEAAELVRHAVRLSPIHSAQGREIPRVAPKFDMLIYARSLIYKDPEESRRSLKALAKAFARAAVIRHEAA